MSDRRLRVLTGSEADREEVIALLDSARVRIVPPEAPSWRHQVLLLALVDLLGRLLPNVTVDLDPTSQAARELPPGAPSLAERVIEAHTHGGLTATTPTTPGLELVVRIGAPPPDGVEADLHVDGAGWQSYLGTSPSRLPAVGTAIDQVPIGPLAAACRAAAAVLARVLAPVSTAIRFVADVTPDSCYSSALTYAASPDPLTEPDLAPSTVDALLVGAGSVGGAAAYALAFTARLTGRLRVVDQQRFEGHNFDRALLATAQVVAGGGDKVQPVLDALAHHRPALEVEPHAIPVTDYHATLAHEATLPLVLAAVDSAEARRAIQDCLPLEVINAACHPHEVTVSGHRTGDGPCVCCLHMPEVLNKKRATNRVMARETGLPERGVAFLRLTDTPLVRDQLAVIERHRGDAPGSLDRYVGQTLEALWREQLLYGATAVKTDHGTTAAVGAPYITALAGVLLAGEALKAGTPEAAIYRLGPTGRAIKYAEDPTAGPFYSQLTNPPRWSGSECLCRSTRRLRLISERYGVKAG